MQKFIVYNWLLLAVVSLLVCIYITVFESFLKDKGYLYVVLTLLFGALFIVKKKGLKGRGNSPKSAVSSPK
jgi:hypothetical protein